MMLKKRFQKMFVAAALAIVCGGGSAWAIGAGDGTEQLGSGQSNTTETDATLQVSFDPEPKVTGVTVTSNALVLTGTGTSAGSVDIGDLNVNDGFDLDNAFNVVIGISDTATADELVNLQSSLSAAAPSGFTITAEVDTADIPTINNELAAGGGGAATGQSLVLSTVGTTLTDLAIDMDDDDSGAPAGNSSSIEVPVDLAIAIDSSVATASGNFTVKFRALFE